MPTGAEGTGMADIKQAAKWMQEGKTVRRAIWKDGHPFMNGRFPPRFISLNQSGYLIGRRDELPVHIGALLAEDWEIVQEPTHD